MSSHLQHQNDWTTGGEKMTEKQAAFLQTLSSQKNVPFNENLNKSEASKEIDRLKSSSSTSTPSSNTNTTTSNNAEDQTATSGTATPPPDSHLAKPQEWTTGDEPATEKQQAYLKVLERQKGETVHPEEMGKSQASAEIERLKHA